MCGYFREILPNSPYTPLNDRYNYHPLAKWERVNCCGEDFCFVTLRRLCDEEDGVFDFTASFRIADIETGIIARRNFSSFSISPSPCREVSSNLSSCMLDLIREFLVE